METVLYKICNEIYLQERLNLILQHYDMKEELAKLLSSIHRWITWLDLIVIFQLPLPSKDPVLC
jgi:hypothetical protein